MTLNWIADPNHSTGHIMAKTPFGIYRAGPRKSDGCWEYMTPACSTFGSHDEHLIDDLDKGQAIARVEAHVQAMAGGTVKTREGSVVDLVTLKKPGMSIFTVFGMLDGFPCHWTSEGRYRMDDQDDPRDLIGLTND